MKISVHKLWQWINSGMSSGSSVHFYLKGLTWIQPGLRLAGRTHKRV